MKQNKIPTETYLVAATFGEGEKEVVYKRMKQQQQKKRTSTIDICILCKRDNPISFPYVR